MRGGGGGGGSKVYENETCYILSHLNRNLGTRHKERFTAMKFPMH